MADPIVLANATKVPERIKAADVLKAQHWNLVHVHELESARLDDFLKTQANSSLKQGHGDPPYAKKLGGKIIRDIIGKYGNDEGLNRGLYDKALSGELGRAVASPAKRIGFTIATIVAGIAEVAIAGAQALVGDSNVFVVLIALLLAFFAWMAGRGLSDFFLQREKDLQSFYKLAEDKTHDFVSARSWLLLGFGLLGIAVLTVVRSMGSTGSGAFIVVGLTLMLAIFVMLGTALVTFFNHEYEDVRGFMFQCQQWFASSKHRVSERHFTETYDLEVDRLIAVRKREEQYAS